MKIKPKHWWQYFNPWHMRKLRAIESYLNSQELRQPLQEGMHKVAYELLHSGNVNVDKIVNEVAQKHFNKNK